MYLWNSSNRSGEPTSKKRQNFKIGKNRKTVRKLAGLLWIESKMRNLSQSTRLMDGHGLGYFAQKVVFWCPRPT
jgi:hypothetical protein